jgi:hypothetical protein
MLHIRAKEVSRLYIEVNWEPLRLILEDESVSRFMFMGSVINSAGVEVFLYKDIIRREYINADRTGNLYRYVHGPESDRVGDYVKISLTEAQAAFRADGVDLQLKDSRRMN